jgi:hypothetical protein
LEQITKIVSWEAFRPVLDRSLNRSAQEKGGRPPYDAVLMFRVLVLQALYNLSDEQTEYQILDRLSFMRFLGLELHDKVPDARTIWLFLEQLIAAQAACRSDNGRAQRTRRQSPAIASLWRSHEIPTAQCLSPIKDATPVP